MKLICVVKFVPDVDSFNYDFEKNTLIRDNVRLTLNPDDACAVAFALKVKEKRPDTFVEVVTMAPTAIVPHMEDLIRIGVDQGIILTDKAFAGSDTYATSKVLASYLSGQVYDCILTGTHAVDGDTSHVPAQLGERLGVNQLSGIVKVNLEHFNEEAAQIVVEHELASVTYEVVMPAILSINRESGYKMPYVRKGDMNKDVKSSLVMLNKEDLGLSTEDTGLKGSLTKVVGTYVKQYEKRDRKIVKVDDAGVETVFNFLKDKGFI
ncbi:MAG: electron transfer flavoprotein subunit beta/FixA family protein [Vallitaleaceae bacterium]|nr:electron transfer flavoprotein subunit beta/FixA family protein [Vallitaleaceae bacterium]